jgi:signal transduction histidine kinase
MLLHQQTVQLAADVQQSRERIVTAREEERRRLRRDLHDGLGPQLASLTLKVDAARDEIAYDPAEAAAMLGDLKGDLQTAIADVRRLVYALRPPALDELGLVGAVRLHLGQSPQHALRITIDASDDIPPLPAAVEVAAYRIIMEAVTNVRRHAQAQSCSVRIAVHDMLEVEIVDDGKGLPEQVQAGIGFISMRERAAELGGICTITNGATKGAIVRAALPF